MAYLGKDSSFDLLFTEDTTSVVRSELTYTSFPTEEISTTSTEVSIYSDETFLPYFVLTEEEFRSWEGTNDENEIVSNDRFRSIYQQK